MQKSNWQNPVREINYPLSAAYANKYADLCKNPALLPFRYEDYRRLSDGVDSSRLARKLHGRAWSSLVEGMIEETTWQKGVLNGPMSYSTLIDYFPYTTTGKQGRILDIAVVNDLVTTEADLTFYDYGPSCHNTWLQVIAKYRDEIDSLRKR